MPLGTESSLKILVSMIDTKFDSLFTIKTLIIYLIYR